MRPPPRYAPSTKSGAHALSARSAMMSCIADGSTTADSGVRCQAIVNASTAMSAAASLPIRPSVRRGACPFSSKAAKASMPHRPLRVGDAFDVARHVLGVGHAVIHRSQAMPAPREVLRGIEQASAARKVACDICWLSRRNGRPEGGAERPGSWPAPSALLASMARSHSVSVPIERLLRLAEPTRRNRSSMIITLECIIVSVVLRPSSTCG